MRSQEAVLDGLAGLPRYARLSAKLAGPVELGCVSTEEFG